MAISLPDPGPPNLDFERPADRDRLDRAAAALAARGFKAQVVASAADARDLVLGAIPDGSEVHVALSETVSEIGVTDEIEQSGRFDSVRSRLNALDRETRDRSAKARRRPGLHTRERTCGDG